MGSVSAKTTPNTLRMHAALAAAISAACLMVLLTTTVKPAEAAFPGTNGKIAFRHGTTTSSHIFVVKPNGSGPKPLTNYREAAQDPEWSADGKKVVFVHDGDLFKMSATGSRVTRLTNSREQEYDPTWSPTGDKIAFVQGRGDWDIFVMNADGSGTPGRLTTDTRDDWEPAWSPDGTEMAFTRSTFLECTDYYCYYDWDIYVKDVSAAESETNQAQPLTEHPPPVILRSRYEWNPSWSPLGNFIVFSSNRDSNDNIYRMRADGTDETPLTDNKADDYEPAYSPSGTKIAFSSNRPGNFEIYKMDYDGAHERRLTFLRGPDDEPNWQPLP
jgi:Tol biopolymer transport system component